MARLVLPGGCRSMPPERARWLWDNAMRKNESLRRDAWAGRARRAV